MHILQCCPSCRNINIWQHWWHKIVYSRQYIAWGTTCRAPKQGPKTGACLDLLGHTRCTPQELWLRPYQQSLTACKGSDTLANAADANIYKAADGQCADRGCTASR